MNRLVLPFAFLVAAPVFAQVPDAPRPATPATIPDERAAGGHEKINFLDFYDVNGDASVPRAEFDSQRAKDFDRINTTHDGTATESQYVDEFTVRLDRQLAAERAAQVKQAHVRFGVLDKNKDGHISREEFEASGKKLFDALDTNHDGVVDEKDKAEKF
ncbi:MAG TPA: hypothetical protein VFQ52_03790 [Rhizomicrobium sp.]|nr:hypothetical protein [Rhizomicrobium sp.]